MIDGYAWQGGRETMLRIGRPAWPTLLILPPLFDEANRTRGNLVMLMRTLADQAEIASVLPDMPGTGDSIVPTVDARFDHWAAAVQALAATLPTPRMTVALRGGALLDRHAQADARWRLAPEHGARLVRDLLRATALAGSEKMAAVEERVRTAPTRLAGTTVHPDLLTGLEAATYDVGIDVRTAAFDDRADVAIAGVPVWRRAEAGEAPDLVAGMAEDICNWVRRCVAP